MSECVVRMEIPHDGLCNLALPFLGGTFCAIGGYRCNYCDGGVRPNWCPIICSLPDGHGRLVDASTVMGAIRLEDLIRKSNVPTIVPATERGLPNATNAF